MIMYNDYALCAHTIICKPPKSYDEINERPDRKQWEQAVNSEIHSLNINNTWYIVKISKGKKPVK